MDALDFRGSSESNQGTQSANSFFDMTITDKLEFTEHQGSLYIKSYPPTLPRTVLKVCGGGGGGWWWWLRPILVFSLSLDQAEHQIRMRIMRLKVMCKNWALCMCMGAKKFVVVEALWTSSRPWFWPFGQAN